MLLVTCQLFAIPSDTISTEKRFTKSLNFYYQPGTVVLSHAFVKGENPNNEPYGTYHGLSLRYAWHTDGRKLWHRLYANPIYGMGLYKCFFTNDYDELGNPWALYAYLHLPLKRWNNWSVNYEMGFGLAWNWNRHDLLENGYYYPIGSYSTVYIDGAFTAKVQLGKRFDLSAAIAYTHFSNGAVRLPNLGVNMIGAKLEVAYLFLDRPVVENYVIPKYLKEWEFIALIIPSLRQVGFEYIDQEGDTVAKSFQYGIVSLSSTFNRQVSHKVKFGVGADITYNSAYGADTVMVNGAPEKAEFRVADKILIGLYPSFELVMGKLSLIAQPGFYVYKQDVSGFETPSTYQRIGVKYHLLKNMVVGINIRAFDFSKADFIEWNIGYRIKWQKSYR